MRLFFWVVRVDIYILPKILLRTVDNYKYWCKIKNLIPSIFALFQKKVQTAFKCKVFGLHLFVLFTLNDPIRLIIIIIPCLKHFYNSLQGFQVFLSNGNIKPTGWGGKSWKIIFLILIFCKVNRRLGEENKKRAFLRNLHSNTKCDDQVGSKIFVFFWWFIVPLKTHTFLNILMQSLCSYFVSLYGVYKNSVYLIFTSLFPLNSIDFL